MFVFSMWIWNVSPVQWNLQKIFHDSFIVILLFSSNVKFLWNHWCYKWCCREIINKSFMWAVMIFSRLIFDRTFDANYFTSGLPKWVSVFVWVTYNNVPAINFCFHLTWKLQLKFTKFNVFSLSFSYQDINFILHGLPCAAFSEKKP